MAGGESSDCIAVWSRRAGFAGGASPCKLGQDLCIVATHMRLTAVSADFFTVSNAIADRVSLGVVGV